jgi:hypothetical protein
MLVGIAGSLITVLISYGALQTNVDRISRENESQKEIVRRLELQQERYATDVEYIKKTLDRLVQRLEFDLPLPKKSFDPMTGRQN